MMYADAWEFGAGPDYIIIILKAFIKSKIWSVETFKHIHTEAPTHMSILTIQSFTYTT